MVFVDKVILEDTILYNLLYGHWADIIWHIWTFESESMQKGHLIREDKVKNDCNWIKYLEKKFNTVFWGR